MLWGRLPRNRAKQARVFLMVRSGYRPDRGLSRGIWHRTIREWACGAACGFLLFRAQNGILFFPSKGNFSRTAAGPFVLCLQFLIEFLRAFCYTTEMLKPGPLIPDSHEKQIKSAVHGASARRSLHETTSALPAQMGGAFSGAFPGKSVCFSWKIA